MEPPNPNFKHRVEQIFSQAAFIADLGITLIDVGAGRCESALEIMPKHLQQDRFIHAGVQAAMADHTAGGAAATLVKADQTVLTVEFKINLLRPAVGDSLRCRAQVLKAGKTLTVVESEVFASNGDQAKLVAKATVTLAVVRLSEHNTQNTGV